MHQWATVVALGIGAGYSLEPLSKEWFDAIALTPEEAEELRYQVNAARADAKVMARLKAGELIMPGM